MMHSGMNKMDSNENNKEKIINNDNLLNPPKKTDQDSSRPESVKFTSIEDDFQEQVMKDISSRPSSTKSIKDDSFKSAKSSVEDNTEMRSSISNNNKDQSSRPVSSNSAKSQQSKTSNKKEVGARSVLDDTDSETVGIMEGETSIVDAKEIEEDVGPSKLQKEDGSHSTKEIKDSVSIQEELSDLYDICEEDYKMIVKLFELYDEDNSGAMCSTELGNMMRSMGKIKSI